VGGEETKNSGTGDEDWGRSRGPVNSVQPEYGGEVPVILTSLGGDRARCGLTGEGKRPHTTEGGTSFVTILKRGDDASQFTEASRSTRPWRGGGVTRTGKGKKKTYA